MKMAKYVRYTFGRFLDYRLVLICALIGPNNVISILYPDSRVSFKNASVNSMEQTATGQGGRSKTTQASPCRTPVVRCTANQTSTCDHPIPHMSNHIGPTTLVMPNQALTNMPERNHISLADQPFTDFSPGEEIFCTTPITPSGLPPMPEQTSFWTPEVPTPGIGFPPSGYYQTPMCDPSPSRMPYSFSNIPPNQVDYGTGRFAPTQRHYSLPDLRVVQAPMPSTNIQGQIEDRFQYFP
jgi:hypothetical protein